MTTFPSPARRLVYRVTTTHTPILTQDDQPPTEPATDDAEVVLLLADSWHSMREGSSEHIVDFDAARIHHVDHDAGTIDSKDLHAEVAFREAEAANRLHILQDLWALGRALAPGHMVLRDVDAYEQHLRETHRQFF